MDFVVLWSRKPLIINNIFQGALLGVIVFLKWISCKEKP